ncbi:MAG: hypothetical protein A3F72_16475 [Bacteroidetes bacterium RIFCSPLOWO2_12_FULL_35_15]|nr:MAG: hypothetical protein A3F72_16475 [Bacteroidetes bacterium RIFCSPLOWO2_12_FULL_35_15]
MKTKNKSFEDFDELVFENKNKTYGAYAIRRSYNDNVTKSLLVTLSFFGCLAFLGVWLTNNKFEVPQLTDSNDPLVITKIFEYNIPEPPKPEVKIKPENSTQKTQSGQFVASNEKDKKIDKAALDLPISKNPNPKGNDSVAKNEDPVVPKLLEEKKPEKIEIIVDQMPEFENMGQYISRNLHYPALAREMETKGIVYLTFVIEIDGSVSNVQILKGIGGGCEQEALRVIKNMPKWKPGINHGKLVRVQCNLPVKFTLQ